MDLSSKKKNKYFVLLLNDLDVVAREVTTATRGISSKVPSVFFALNLQDFACYTH